MKEFDIVFLHTGEVHVKNFQNLVDRFAPELSTHHLVNASWLEHAQKHGIDEELKSSVEDALLSVAGKARLILCTCSSIGSLVENADLDHEVILQRIDRAMADQAVSGYRRILVLAALESTLEPTKALLEESIARTGTASGERPSVELRVIEHAWPHFLNGDMEKYLAPIRAEILRSQDEYDAVVLAQASMSRAQSDGDYTIPVLSSPESGVKQAINTLSGLESTTGLLYT